MLEPLPSARSRFRDYAQHNAGGGGHAWTRYSKENLTCHAKVCPLITAFCFLLLPLRISLILNLD